MILFKIIVFAAVEAVSGRMDSFYVPDPDIWPQEDLLEAWQMPRTPTLTQPTQDDTGQSTPLHPLEPHISKAADRFTFPSDQLVRKKPKK